MNWHSRAAVRSVPAHAVVAAHVVARVESGFTDADDLEARVDRAFATLDQRQPTVARFVDRAVDAVSDETAQALGHFLGVAMFEAFDAAFGTRVGPVDEAALEVARGSLEVDEDMRRASPDEVLETDDLVAIGQPHLMAFVRRQLEAALESDEDGEPADVDLEAINAVYRAVLVVIVAFSQAVAAPAGARAPRGGMFA
jgi:hypothetical protein